MEEPKNTRTQEEAVAEWINNFSPLTDQELFKKALGKYIPASSVLQMIQFNQTYQKFLLLLAPKNIVDFQYLYWQEFFFIWQRFLSANHENEKMENIKTIGNSVLIFIKDFHLLHVEHFQGFLKITDMFDVKTTHQIELGLEQIKELLSPNHSATAHFEIWRTILEKKTQHLLQDLDRALNNAKGKIVPIT